VEERGGVRRRAGAGGATGWWRGCHGIEEGELPRNWESGGCREVENGGCGAAG
jgi:hypothetical protein